MRRIALLAALAGGSCSLSPKIDLGLHMTCKNSDGNPPSPDACDKVALDCANFVELRIYEVRNGSTGTILRSTCLATADLGNPPTLCSVFQTHAALISDLPRGGTVVFRLRAFHAYDLAHGACNDDLADVKPTPIFDGYSAPVILDGADYHVNINVTSCFQCTVLSTHPTCSPCSPCPTGQTAMPDPPAGGARCCPSPAPVPCLTVGAPCGDGTIALMPPGGCCAVCTPHAG